MPVYYREAVGWSAVWPYARAVLPDGFPVGIDNGIHAVVLKEYSGMLSLAVAHARILSGGDASGGIGEFGIFIVIHEVQPGLAAESAAGGGLRYGCSVCVVDSFSLCLMICEFGKSFSAFSLDRKYFSGTSGIRISDKEHALSALGKVSRAVNTLPFAQIPQSR